MGLEYKTLNWEAEITDEGYFEGWLTRYGEKDAYGDIVVKGAFSSALKEKKEFPLLWQHKQEELIGRAFIEETDEGVKVKGEIITEITRGKEAYILAKKGILKGISYGYFPTDVDYKNGARLLKGIKLLEVSLVSLPALESAQITEVKTVLNNDDLPLWEDRNRKWDASQARKRIAKWASSDGSGDKDKIDWNKYKRAFLYVVKGQEENITGYKFPIADVIDGRLYAIPRAIFNAVVRLSVARIPESEKEGIRRVLARYYEKMGETPPWKEEKSINLEAYIHEILDWEEELRSVDKEVLQQLKTAIDDILGEGKQVAQEDSEETKTLLELWYALKTFRKEVEK